MSSVIEQMLVLLLLLALGVLLRKTGVTDTEGNKKLNKLAINFCQCGMVLASVMNVEPTLKSVELLLIVGVSFITHAIIGGIGFFLPLLLHAPRSERGIYRFMAMFGNMGFMGFPVVASIFGSEAVFYASLFNIPMNVLAYSVGVVMLTDGGEKGRFNPKSLINTPLIGTLAAIIIFVFRIPIPGVIERTASIVGDTIVPLSMVIIGGSLGDVSLKEVFGDWRLYIFLPFKLIIGPVVVWAILRLFVQNPLILGIATVLAAMPVAVISTMLSIQYKLDTSLSSRGVFLSTVLSVATIPLVVYLLLV